MKTNGSFAAQPKVCIAWFASVWLPIMTSAPVAGALGYELVSMLVHLSFVISAAGVLLLAVKVGAVSGRSSL